jgi:hypothetical protein
VRFKPTYKLEKDHKLQISTKLMETALLNTFWLCKKLAGGA